MQVGRGRGLCPRLLRRSVLDGKESSLKAALQELECERGKEHALRGRLEEQRLRHLREEGQSSKTLEVPGRRGQWAAGPVGGGASGRWGWRGPSPPLPVGMCPAAGRDGGIFIVTHGCWGWTGGTVSRGRSCGLQTFRREARAGDGGTAPSVDGGARQLRPDSAILPLGSPRAIRSPGRS